MLNLQFLLKEQVATMANITFAQLQLMHKLCPFLQAAAHILSYTFRHLKNGLYVYMAFALKTT